MEKNPSNEEWAKKKTDKDQPKRKKGFHVVVRLNHSYPDGPSMIRNPFKCPSRVDLLAARDSALLANSAPQKIATKIIKIHAPSPFNANLWTGLSSHEESNLFMSCLKYGSE